MVAEATSGIDLDPTGFRSGSSWSPTASHQIADSSAKQVSHRGHNTLESYGSDVWLGSGKRDDLVPVCRGAGGDLKA